ncbi:Fc.00g108200.m01.CDS01 [Cosmosporella sp. VM-42]
MAQNGIQKTVLQLPNGLGITASTSPKLPTSPIPGNQSGIVVFSGGSAANNLVDVFETVREANQCKLSYVIPISDNGGSSSELIRVFGGPGIGDVRSRLVRLIPDDGNPETAAIKHFFNHRLPKVYEDARAEWFEILEASHSLWNDISSPKRELIRSYLNSFNVEVVKRMRPSSRFDYSGASIGNLFLTGARLFTGSFEAAVYLLSSICAVPNRIAVLPALNTNFALHIAAGLTDGTVITGQNDISHPSAPTAAVPGTSAGLHSPATLTRHDTWDHDKVEDANLPGTLPALRRPAITFSKDQEEDLPARIDRIWYINPYGQEIRIPANPRVLDALHTSHSIVYSIGSLFTSLIPSLVLRGVGEALASPLIRNKILILNGTTDRETGPSHNPFAGLDFVASIANACADSRGLPKPSEDDYCQYVTHVIYIEGPNAPKVDKQYFGQIGIDATRLYGPKDGSGKGGRYDSKALTQTLESIVGRKDARADRSRRNTLVG